MRDSFEFNLPETVSNPVDVYNVRSEPFKIYGLYKPWEPGVFKRMPVEVGEATSENVRLLCTNTAGGRVRFKTDSPYIAVGAVYAPMKFPTPRAVTLSGIGAYCFDLYADNQFCSVMVPNRIEQNGSINNFVITEGKYESFYSFGQAKLREITINFPSFVDISDVYIGLSEGSVVEKGNNYANEKPVVFYGSSITNGACASRPGNIYPNILSRRLNMDYINLGFSGSAKAEDAIIEYISGLPMSVFVFDYDHNAPSTDYLEETHYSSLKKFRKVQPDTPIIMLSRPNRCGGIKEVTERERIIKASYDKMIENGDKNVFFISGQEIYNKLDSEMMTIDGVHPTDLGFYCMAEAIEKIIKNIF